MPVGISGWNSVMGSYYQTWWPKAAIWKAEQEAVKVEARLSYIREVLLKEEQEKNSVYVLGVVVVMMKLAIMQRKGQMMTPS